MTSSWDAYFEQLSSIVTEIQTTESDDTEGLLHLKETLGIALESLHSIKLCPGMPSEIIEEIVTQSKFLTKWSTEVLLQTVVKTIK